MQGLVTPLLLCCVTAEGATRAKFSTPNGIFFSSALLRACPTHTQFNVRFHLLRACHQSPCSRLKAEGIKRQESFTYGDISFVH
jgi:hypothetical protein